MWESIPPQAEEDAVAQGSIRKEMQSALIVRYADKKNNSFVANSRTSSVSRSGVTVYRQGDALRVEYDFSRQKEQFVIPVVYALEGERFTAEILFDEIREYGETRIVEVKLLPYFGAGKTGEEGFLFVPDGSGAIVDFGNTRSWASGYAKQVYGRDPAKSDYAYASSQEQVYMPVYGVCREGSAFLAVLSRGDANASIEATQAGSSSEYASVAPVFSYRLLDQMKMQDKYGTEKSITFESRRTVEENPQVTFLFAPRETAGLAGMAGLYRAWLMEKEGLSRLSSPQAKPLFLDIYGVSQKKERAAGFSEISRWTDPSGAKRRSPASPRKARNRAANCFTPWTTSASAAEAGAGGPSTAPRPTCCRPACLNTNTRPISGPSTRKTRSGFT